MSQAFVKESDEQWLHDVAPTLNALIVYLTRANNGIRVYEQKTIIDKKYATQAEIDEINKRVSDQVAESVKFAEESPWPADDELLKDVYVDKEYPFIVD